MPHDIRIWPTGLATLAGRRVRLLGYSRRAGQSGGTALLTRCGSRVCIAAFDYNGGLGGTRSNPRRPRTSRSLRSAQISTGRHGGGWRCAHQSIVVIFA